MKLSGLKTKGRTVDLKTRFGSHIRKSNNDCQEWIGHRDKQGYGVLSVYLKNGKRTTMLAHRVAYLLEHKEIPDELCVLHLCDNPPCVNPDHLYIGTRSDNLKDAYERSPYRVSFFTRTGQQGEQNFHAKLTQKQVNEIRERYTCGNVNQSLLAKEYDVSKNHISCITRHIYWREGR